MCSILGIAAFNAPEDWRDEVVRELFREAESRGKHSSGVAYVKDGATRVVKLPIPGSEFAWSQELDEILTQDNPEIMIGHTRNKTQGHEKELMNNHPLFSKRTGIAVVHNGSVRDSLWRAKDSDGNNPYILDEFEAEVDSEAIVRLIDTLLHIPRGEDGKIFSDIVEATPKDQWVRNEDISTLQAIDEATYNLSGGNTCALLDPAYPNAFFLWKVRNPLYVALVPEYETIVFASEKKMVEAALNVCDYETYAGGFFYKKLEDSHTPEYIIREFPEGRALSFQYNGDLEEGLFDVEDRQLDPNGADFTKSIISGTKFVADKEAVKEA